jgi:4-hydroxy-tetrahydrodipicolinate synthase
MFSGIWLPIVTPLRNGEVDIDALQGLADYYLHTEISGFVALSTTGEAALLSQAERISVLHALSEVIGSRLPMLIGVGGSNTHDVLHEMQRYERWDCAGYLVSAPSYVCPDQAGVHWHFEQAAHATERPIVLYNVPHRTGVTIEPDTVARLVECENIVAIKECVKAHFARLSGLPINLLCGTDEAFDACLEHGGTGGILASAHVCADLLITLRESVLSGHDMDARHLFASLLPVLRLLFAAPNPSAIKAMLAFDHSLSDETRMPITRASAQLVGRLSIARDRLQDLRAEFASTMT